MAEKHGSVFIHLRIRKSSVSIFDPVTLSLQYNKSLFDYLRIHLKYIRIKVDNLLHEHMILEIK